MGGDIDVESLLADPRCHGIVHNTSSDFVSNYILYTPAVQVVITVLLPILFVVGTVDNLAFMYVVYNIQRMKTPTNICLINLAAADIVYLISSTTKRLWLYTQSANRHDDSPIGQSGCIVFSLISNTAFFASISFITMVSIERYFKVCKPLKTRGRSKARQRLFKIILPLLWIIALGYSLSFIPDNLTVKTVCIDWSSAGKEFSSIPPLWILCQIYNNNKTYTIYRSFAQFLPFFTAFVVSVVLYGIIIHRLHTTAKRSTAKGKKIQIRNQVAWMLIVNGTVFFLLLAPSELLYLIDGFVAIIPNAKPIDGFDSMISKITMPFSYLNSVVNPIIYVAMSSRYRNAFKTTFSCDRLSLRSSGSRYSKQNTMEETVNSVSTGVSTSMRESTPLEELPS